VTYEFFTRSFKSAIVGACLLAASSVSAVAVTFAGTSDVSIGSFVFANYGVVGPSETSVFTFTALENLQISTIGMTGNGFSDGADLALTTFGLTAATGSTWDEIDVDPPIGVATGFLGGFSLLAGQSFNIFLQVGAASLPVSATANFEVSAIPVPASLPLALSAIGLLGFAARRRKRTATA
jgi:hypothetical protein